MNFKRKTCRIKIRKFRKPQARRSYRKGESGKTVISNWFWGYRTEQIRFIGELNDIQETHNYNKIYGSTYSGYRGDIFDYTKEEYHSLIGEKRIYISEDYTTKEELGYPF